MSRFVSCLQFSFDLSGGTAELLAGCASNGVGALLLKLRWFQRRHRKWAGWQAVDQESQVGRELRQVHQVVFGDITAELLREEFCIRGTDLKAEHRTDVAEDGRERDFVELLQELVREHERRPILATLGKNRCEGAVAGRDEVLKLVDCDAEVGTLRFREFCSTHGRELQTADEQ